MKKSLFILFIFSIILSNLSLHAEDIIIPIISKPSTLEEGVARKLSDSQVEELLPWAKDSKIFLVELLDSVDDLNMAGKNEKLLTGIKTVVTESTPDSSELLMRYALNRGLVIYDILNKETNKDAIGISDVKLRVLTSTINMAIKYYEIDIDALSQKSKITFADFGKDYYNFLAELNKSIFDASAQYAIQRTTLEWLQWDLYRDSNNTKYAARIVKINNALKDFPAQRLSDSQSIAFLKDMKKLAAEIKVRKEDAGFSVGENVFFLGNNKFAYIDSISDDEGSYTLKFTNGSKVKSASLSDIALSSGCGPKYCVKDKLILDRAYEVTIIAIKRDGSYVYKYNENSMKHGTVETTDQASRLMYQ